MQAHAYGYHVIRIKYPPSPPLLSPPLPSSLAYFCVGEHGYIRETRDCDIPIVARHSTIIQVVVWLSCDIYTGWAQLMEEMRRWAPIGVVAAIVPWNFPLMLLSWKVGREGVS